MTITPQLMQIYRALADKGFGNRSPKEQERIISQALRAADFVPPGEELSLHEMAEDAGIDLQASEQHSGFARAKATADRIGFGASEKFAATVDRGTWVKGTLPSSHRWQARVFQRATVYGIPEVPRIEDLLIADPRGIAIVEYSRGWDTKPKSGDIAVYNAATTAALGAVKSANAREKFASGSGIEAEARREYEGLIGRGQQSWVSALYREAFPGQPPLTHREMIIKLLEKDYGKAVTAKVVHARAGARARFGQYDEEFRYLQYQSMNQPALAKKNLLVLARKLGADVHSSTADADRLAALAVKLRMESEMWKAYDGPMPHARTGGKDSFAFSKDLGRQLRAVRSDIASQQANLRADDKEGHWSNCYSRCVALSALYGNGGGGLASIYRELMNTKATGREETNGGNYSRAGGKALMGSMPRTQEEMWKALTDPNFRSLAPWRRQGLLRQARTTSWWRPPGAEMNMGELADTLDGGPGFNPRPIVRARDDNARPESSAVARRLGAFARDRFAEAAKPSAKAVASLKKLIEKTRAHAKVFADPETRRMYEGDAEGYGAVLYSVNQNNASGAKYSLQMMDTAARDEVPDEILAWAGFTILRPKGFAREGGPAKPSASAIAEMKALIKKAKAEAEGASRPSDRNWWMEEAEQYEAILQAVLRNDPHEVSVIADGMSKNAADRIPMAIITWGDYAT